MPNVVKEIKEIVAFLKVFIPHPIRGMKILPLWDWPSVITIQAALAVLSGTLTVFVQGTWVAPFLDILLFPILNLAFTLVGAVFFHYLFIFLFRSRYGLDRLFLIIAIANVPYMFLRVFAPVVPPVEPIAMGVTALLLSVGFSENLGLPKGRIVRVMGVLYFLFFLVWMFSHIQMTQREDRFKSTISSL